MIDLQQNYHTSHISYCIVYVHDVLSFMEHVLDCMDHHEDLIFSGFHNHYEQQVWSHLGRCYGTMANS